MLRTRMTAALLGTIAWIGLTAAGAQTAAPAAPAAATGSISGTIKDKKTGHPVIEAGVEVLGIGKKTRTDIEGKYAIKGVPAGTYELRIFAPLYQGLRIPKVVVEVGDETTASTYLVATKQGVLIVEVIAKAAKRAESAQLLRRKEASVVSENISAEAIAKSTDSDAAEVVSRAGSVTIANDKFFSVRGLRERYSATLLNSSKLSSTDPEKRVVPLDLFPSEFIESVSLVKSFSPELPGDFAGALALIDLKEYPDEPHFNLSMGSSYNSDFTGQKFLSYKRNSKTDYFGFGKNGRELPDAFGDTKITPNRSPALARLLPDSWNTSSFDAAPNSNLTVSTGHRWGGFGFEMGGVYTTEFKGQRNSLFQKLTTTGSQNGGGGEVDITKQFRGDTYRFATRLSGVLSSGLKLSDDHELSFAGFLNRSSLDQVRQLSGLLKQYAGDRIDETIIGYTEEELAYGQLKGRHHFEWLDVDWRSAFTRTTQDAPDVRKVASDTKPGLPPQFLNSDGSGYRTFQTLTEYLTDSALDFTVPFPIWSELTAKFRFGGAYAKRDRGFRLRIFRNNPRGGLDPFNDPETVLDPANVPSLLDFSEVSTNRDRFTGSEETIAGYGSFDVPIVRDMLRLNAGVRFEYSLIKLGTADDQDNAVTKRKKNNNPLPAVNLIFSPRTDMNLRASWSRTVVRPDFRELNPSYNIVADNDDFEPFVGNPDIVQSDVENIDLRWEWFVSPNELISLGLFRKDITLPTEKTYLAFSSDNVFTVKNNKDATIQGIEVETKKNLGFIHPFLEHFSLGANFSYIKSRVSVLSGGATDSGGDTNGRALQGQSPFVANGSLQWDHPDWGSVQLAYNTAGRYIDVIGVKGLPEIFVERRDSLDFSMSAKLQKLGLPGSLKLAAENLTNDSVEQTQADIARLRYRKGVKFSLGISFQF